MMNSIPKDVIMKTISSQVAKVGQESTITLLVLDKNTGNPMDNANVILHIEEGAPMESMEGKTMMDMMQGMFEAENIGSGNYEVKFTPTEKGYYTMHTHAIPPGKSMMSMMDNHMDIGIIAK
jgi:5-hydroxyisourate hydrolase-like protein (transthyretin family)